MTFFTLSDGSLARYSDGATVRPLYSMSIRDITNSLQLRATIRAGKYSNWGGYPLFLVTNDGASLCFDCARKEYYLLARSMRDQSNDGWRVVACDVNYEDHALFCDHCGGQIPSAYSEE